MARSKASYKAAAKKAVATRRRNARGSSSTKRTPAKTRTKRRATRKKSGMLSELFNPKMAQAAGKTVLSGAVGGAVVGMAEKLMTTATDNQKLIAMAGMSFVAATILKAPNVGAGMAGVAIYKAMTAAGMLSDDGLDLQEHNFADPIEALPMVLNEDGSELYLEEDDLYLEESDYGVGYPSSAEFWQ